MAGLTGCSAGSLPPIPQPKPTSVLFLEAPPASLAVNAKATIDAATVFSAAGSGENQAVTYALSCGSTNACGALSASDEAGAIVYTAPPAIPTGNAVTVTATSVVDSSLSATAKITIVPPIPISVTLLGAPPASLEVNAQFAFHAQITNDVTANPEVTWTVTCGSAACGSFSPATTPNEEPATYTAPATIPDGNTVTVTATSVTDPTKSASASMAITAQAPTLADGSYVFQVAGVVGNGAGFVTGALIAQGGTIAGGEQDAIYGDSNDDNGGSISEFQTISGGSYSTTPDGNLAVTIQLGAGETETLNGTLASNQKGFIGGIDGAIGNGTLEAQTSTAAPSGGYAFSLDAADDYDGSPWIDGVIDVDSAGGISGNGSLLDVNGEGTFYAGTETLAASTVSAPDAYGRVVFQLNPASEPPEWQLGTLYVAGYAVDGTHMRVMEVGTAQNSDVVPGEAGGVALAQAANTGKFDAASVAGASYVFGAEGEDRQGTLQLAGVLTFDAGGNVTGVMNWNDLSGKTAQAPLACTGTYTVDPTGRVTVTDLTDGSTFTYSLHLYLSGSGSGVVLSADSSDVFAGRAFEQQAGAFSATSFSGSYGVNASLYTLANLGPEFESAVGPITATPGDGSDDVAGYADLGAGSPDFAITGSFTPAANGVFTGTLSGLGGSAANSFTLYLVDGTQGVLVETGGSTLVLARVGRQ